MEKDQKTTLLEKLHISLITKTKNELPWNFVANQIKTDIDVMSWCPTPFGSGTYKTLFGKNISYNQTYWKTHLESRDLMDKKKNS